MNDSNIAFVVGNEELCSNKVTAAEDYYKSKDQFDSNLNNGLSKDQ